jgi:SAM-dependent methyltransferase
VREQALMEPIPETFMEPRDESLYEAPAHRPHQDLEWLEKYSCVQSMQFMIDCLPVIDELVATFPHAVPIRVLDVGTGSGAGAHLLATRHASSFLGAQMIVDAVELDGGYLERYVKARFKNINYIVGDVMDLRPEQPWDLVLCSHTLEHIEDPVPFVEHLQSLARKWVVFYTPWEEPLGETPGHVLTIDRRFLARVKAVKHHVLTSPAWGKPAFKDGKCVVFVLPGTADRPAPVPKPPLTLKRAVRGILRRIRSACSILVPRRPPVSTEPPTNAKVWEEMRDARLRSKG